jgi:uracil-DNA glycosylase family 4
MKQLLKEACLGTHKNCKYCPWNPKVVGPIAFGVSCEEHGVNWSSPGKAISMQIVQDPAGTTPGKTGRLCFVHNSKNPTDRTAQHAYNLWKATVSFDVDTDTDPYLKNHYWTNALLHGADKKNQPELREPIVMESARKECSKLLGEQINLISPKVIIANGEWAAKSLFDLKLLSSDWKDLKQDFAQRVHKEIKKLSSGETVLVFCTYHTAITPINTHIARLYSAEIQLKLDEKLKKYARYPKVISFLNNYPSHDPEGKGMRVLLLHWLEIGEAIRDAYRIGHVRT